MCYFTIIVFNGTIECMSNVITLKLTHAQEAKLYEAWSENAKTPPQYAKWQLKCENCVITCYTSGKTVFQGKEANVYASPFMEEELMQPKIAVKDILPQAGSDEVGTGDYFGPIVVTASYVSKENIDFLLNLKVKDSKKLSDEQIIQIVPKIIQKIPYQTFILKNKEYNLRKSENMNMNQMKAILHNKVLYELKKKNYPYQYIVVDQFEPAFSYYKHIHTSTKKVDDIFFLTKAEDQCLSVACSSLISRYIFLKEMNSLSESLGINLPKGAGPMVDEVAKKIVEKFGKEKLNEIAKLNFKNTDKILSN